MKRLLLLALFGSLTIAACENNAVKTEQLNRVIWSDDNTEQALIVLKFEEKKSMNPLSSNNLKSNFSHQIFVQDRNGGNRRAIGNEFLGQNAFDFYYMKSSGYMIASFIEASEENNPVVRYYHLNVSNGGVTRLTSKPDMRVIPSPDGAYLALTTFYPSTCNNPAGNCPVDLEFMSSETLETVGKKHQLNFNNGKSPEMTWNLGQKFILTTDEEAFSIMPGDESPIETEIPACTFPQTTSSSVAASGDFVYANNMQILTRPTTHSEQAFGCQDILN